MENSRRSFLKKAGIGVPASVVFLNNFGTGFGDAITAMMASAHLCASVPDFFIKPGIGLDLIEDGIRKYATPGIPFFE